MAHGLLNTSCVQLQAWATLVQLHCHQADQPSLSRHAVSSLRLALFDGLIPTACDQSF